MCAKAGHKETEKLRAMSKIFAAEVIQLVVNTIYKVVKGSSGLDSDVAAEFLGKKY